MHCIEPAEVLAFDAGSDGASQFIGARLSPQPETADRAMSEETQSVHLAEALHYRPKLMLG